MSTAAAAGFNAVRFVLHVLPGTLLAGVIAVATTTRQNP